MMIISRIIKKSNLFYKLALESLNFKKIAAEDDNLEDLKNLESKLKNPSTALEAVEEIQDNTLDEDLAEEFSKLVFVDMANEKSPFKVIMESVAEWQNSIKNGKRISVEDSLVDSLQEFMDRKDKILDLLQNMDDDDDNYPKHIFNMALDAIRKLCESQIGKLFNTSRTSIETFADYCRRLQGNDESMIEAMKAKMTGPVGGPTGTVDFERTVQKLDTDSEKRKEKNRQYSEQYRKQLRIAKSYGDPNTWTDEEWKEKEKILGQKGMERVCAYWNALSTLNEKRREYFEDKYHGDPEWRKEYARKANIRVKRERAKWSTTSLKEALEQYEKLKESINKNSKKSLYAELEALEDKLDQLDPDKLGEDKYERLKVEIEDKIEKKEDEIEQVKEKLEIIEKEVERIKFKRDKAHQVALEAAKQTADVKGTVKWFDPISEKWKTKTDWDRILWGSGGWKVHFQQNIANERSDMKKRIFEKLASDPELMQKYEKLLQELSDTEATRAPIPIGSEKHRQHTLNVYEVAKKLEQVILSDIDRLQDVKVLLTNYKNTILLSKDFRLFVNQKINDLSKLRLDEFLADEEAVLDEDRMEKINHIIEECHRFLELFLEQDKSHIRWMRSCQLRIMTEFLPRIVGVKELSLRRAELKRASESAKTEKDEES